MPRAPAPRVAVDVTPRLLSDAVSRVLLDHGLEVITQPDEHTIDNCDVVVTSHRFPPEESGVIVAVLPGGRAPDAAGAPQPPFAEPARVRNLEQLLATIRVFICALATT